MEWIDRMNRAVDYIEKHLTGELAFAEIAKAACCSPYHFQRMFSFIADVPLSEYIRRRRLTLAAFELQSSAAKVVDVALKYGYDSPEAFARAFHQLHGATPTAARSAGTPLKAYPRIVFHLTVKGGTEMNYRIEETESFSVIGLSERVDTERAFETVPRIWTEARERGDFGRLWELRKEHPVRGLLGVCADGEFGRNEQFDYILAVVSDAEPPEDMAKLDFPGVQWAVFEAEGPPDALQDVWRRLYTEWVPSSAYELAYLPAVECYLPAEEGKNELWVPVVKKKPAPL